MLRNNRPTDPEHWYCETSQAANGGHQFVATTSFPFPSFLRIDSPPWGVGTSVSYAVAPGSQHIYNRQIRALTTGHMHQGGGEKGNPPDPCLYTHSRFRGNKGESSVAL